MTEEQFKGICKGEVVVCNKTHQNSSGAPHFREGNFYIVRGTSSYDSLLVEADDQGRPDNGWDYKFFDLVGPKATKEDCL